MWFYTLIIASIMTACIISTNNYNTTDKNYSSTLVGDSLRIFVINFIALYAGFYFFGGKSVTEHQIHTGDAPF